MVEAAINRIWVELDTASLSVSRDAGVRKCGMSTYPATMEKIARMINGATIDDGDSWTWWTSCSEYRGAP